MRGSRWMWGVVALIAVLAAQLGLRPAQANRKVGPSAGWVLETWGLQEAQEAQLFVGGSGFALNYHVADFPGKPTNPASSIVATLTFPAHIRFTHHNNGPGTTTVVKGNTITHTTTGSAGAAGGQFFFEFLATEDPLKAVSFRLKVDVNAKQNVKFDVTDTYGAASARYTGTTNPSEKQGIHPGDVVSAQFTLTLTVTTGDPVVKKLVSFGVGSAGTLVPGSPTPEARDETETGGIWEIDSNGPTSFSFQGVVKPESEIPEDTTHLFVGSGAILHVRRSEINRAGKSVTRTYQVPALPFRRFIPITKVPLKLEYATETVSPGQVKEGETVSYTLKATSVSKLTSLTLTNKLPPDVQLVRGSVQPVAQNRGGTLTWEFENVTTATVKFKLKVLEQKPEIQFITNQGRAEGVTEGGEKVSVDQNSALRYLHAEILVRAVDANPRHLDGLFLPDAANAPKVLELDWDNLRQVEGVATDGVTLLLVRARIKANKHGRIRIVVVEDEDGAPTGSVWPLNATALMDTSANGGARDTMPAGADNVTVDAQKIKGDKDYEYAYCLYRTPRDFDGPKTASLQNRLVKLRVELLTPDNQTVMGTGEMATKLVRPLVLLQHGTFDSPEGWSYSPMWMESGNGLRGYTGWTANFPFQTDRPSFSIVEGGAGPLAQNVTFARQSANVIFDDWRKQTQVAASQVDVICHSQGGVAWRMIAQTQTDPNPITPLQQGPNFRHAGNWGHGMLHKLITMASTHRGSAVSNFSAYMNHHGIIRGFVREASHYMKAPIDMGGVEDQMVVAPALLAIKETRVPGHALVGSGLPEFNQSYVDRLNAFWWADSTSGPFKSVGLLRDITGVRWDRYRMIANYGFNLDYTQQVDDVRQDPNFDLTVSSYSSKGRIAPGAVSDHGAIEVQSGLEPGTLIGRLTHGDQIFSDGTNPIPARAVANRMAFLLRQPTKSAFFAFFPAVGAGVLTPTERQYSNPNLFNPQWLYETVSLTPRSRLAAVPTISTDPNGPDVSVGETVHVNVAWPGKTIKDVLLVYPGQSGAPGFAALTEGKVTHSFVVPARPPGSFPIGAFFTATDGTVDKAEAMLEIAAPLQYSALKSIPARLDIRDTLPAGVEIYGRNNQNVWEEVTQSRHLTLQSGNADVLRVEIDGTLTPTGFGSTTLTARYKNLSVATPVEVSGETVRAVVAPKKKGKVKAASRKAVEWVFLSGPGFNALNIDPKSIRIKNLPPTGLKQKDYNKDRVPDLAALLAPKSLALTLGTVRVPMFAALSKGGLVKGEAVATVK